MSFLNMQLTKKTCHHVLYNLLIYMTSFAMITPEEYRKLVDYENKIFDLTKIFTTLEILNKYRHTDEATNKNYRKLKTHLKFIL